MWARTQSLCVHLNVGQSLCEKNIVNALPKVVAFPRVLPQGKLTGGLGPTVIGSRCCGDPALEAKLNKKQ